MRKRLPMSALITGLLAAPVIGGMTAARAAELLGAPTSGQVLAEAFPAEMPAEVAAKMRRLLRGEKPDALGMQSLQTRIALAMQAHLLHRNASRAGDPCYPIDMAASQPAIPTPHAEKVTYLGVSAQPVSPAMGEQLNLAPGVGLLVEFVEPGSPADKAGLKLHDVVHKIDDQWLINPPQMQVLVRDHKPGDVVTFAVIRAGKPVEIKATLAEKEVVGEPPVAAVPPQNNATAKSYTLMRADGELEITIHGDNAGRRLTVKDLAAGKIIYDGRADTMEDLKDLPAPVLDKVKAALEKVK